MRLAIARLHRVLASTLTLGALAACSTDVAVAPAPVGASWASGSRLRAVVLDGGQGAEQFESFYDTTYGEPCQFERASDGEVRCLPMRQATFEPVFYADAACSTPITAVPSCAPAMQHVATLLADSCGTLEVHELGAPLDGASVYSPNGGCHETTLGPGLVPYSLGAVVPPSAFVRATEQDEPLDDRITRTVAVGDDGSRVITGAIDRAFGAGCWDPAHGPFAGRCIPISSATSTGWFADATCANHAWIASDEACTSRPVLIAIDVSSKCHTTGQIVGVYRIGPTVTGPLFLGYDGQCSASGEQTYGVAGAAFAPEDFPALSQAEFGSGALTWRGPATASGTPLRAFGELFDRERGVTCRALELAGGGLRCLPDDAATVLAPSRFADEACTIPVVAEETSGCDPSGPPTVALLFSGDACSSVKEARSVSSTTLSSVYSKTDAGCVAAPEDASGYRAVGAPLDPSSFPAVTRVVQ